MRKHSKMEAGRSVLNVLLLYCFLAIARACWVYGRCNFVILLNMIFLLEDASSISEV